MPEGLGCQVCGAATIAGIEQWHLVCVCCGHETSKEPRTGSRTLPGLERSRGAVNSYVMELITAMGTQAGKRLLDVGCGSGHLVQVARAQGFDADGVDDLSAGFEQPTLCPSLLIGTIADAQGPYEVITYVDVVEHICDVRRELLMVKDKLAAGGKIVIVTPCKDSIIYAAAKPLRMFGFRHLFEAFWNIGFRSPHFHIFSCRSLEALARQCGFSQEQTLFCTGMRMADALLPNSWLRYVAVSMVMVLRIDEG